MKNPLTPPKATTSYKIVTVIMCATAILMLMTLFTSCASTGHSSIYGNQNPQCGAYQCVDIEN